MKFNLTLLKIISLATFTVGFVSPAKIAEAGAAPATNEAYEQVETHGAKGHSKGISAVPKVFLTKRAIRIEFITFLSLIGLSIIIPELYYKPKKKNQSTKSINNESSQEPTNDIDLDTLASKVNYELLASKVDYDQLKPFNMSKNNSATNGKLDNHGKSDQTVA